MKTLIVEDDPVSGLLLNKILAVYGQCDAALTGHEAQAALNRSWQENAPYQLVCLDIMLPDTDGQELLKFIRKNEARRNIVGLDGARILMITALGDNRNILEAFRSQCEGYFVKPIRREKIIAQLSEFGLIGNTTE